MKQIYSIQSEAMVDARRAAQITRLPRYWFTTAEMRMLHQVPHYQLQGRVRFRISELTNWLEWHTRRSTP